MAPASNHYPVPEDIYLQLPQGRFCLRRWRGDGPLLLCLHGWQDNAASFAPLAGEGFNLLALELAGHGHSCHRSPGQHYHLADHLLDVLDVLDALQEKPAAVLAHSLGGAIASFAAAARPEAIPALLLIEALGPLASDPETALKRLRDTAGARAKRKAADSHRTVDLNRAIAARRKLGPDQSALAGLLVERNLRGSPKGLRWRSDPRIREPSPWRVDADTIRALLGGIEQPTLIMVGKDSRLPIGAEQRLDWLGTQARLQRLPGDHHLHMSQPKETADAIRGFLETSLSAKTIGTHSQDGC
jgi:pimeloyl-ACP methyl ester carboxylesterase